MVALHFIIVELFVFIANFNASKVIADGASFLQADVVGA